MPAEKLPPASDRVVLRDVVPVLVGLPALLAWDRSGLDLTLAHRYGTPQGFGWHDHWFTAGLMHDGVLALSWAVFAWLLVGVWRPAAFALALSRRERVWWVGATVACTLLIAILRRTSTTSCPWSLAEFGGGVATYVSHSVWEVHDGGPGRCFPSAHAASAFAFLSGWLALRRAAPRASRLWLLLTLTAGLALTWVQAVRGAHFVSHGLWAGWICWATTVGLFHASRAWRENTPTPGTD